MAAKDGGEDEPHGLMPSAELRAALKRSGRKPASCVVGLTKDRQAVILLHRLKRPRKLLGEAKAQAKAAGLVLDLASLRFGRVSVSGGSDSAQAGFTVNKPVPPAVQQAMRAPMRAAGHPRFTVSADPSLEDEADGADEADQDGDDADPDGDGAGSGATMRPAAAATGGAAASAGAATGAAAPAGPSGAPPSPGAASGPPAGPGGASRAGSPDAALRVRLTALVKCVSAAVKSGQPGSERLLAAAEAAHGALRSGNLAAAGGRADALERLLGGPDAPAGVAGAPATGDAAPGTQAPGGVGQAAPPGAAALKGELTGLVQRIGPAIAADPSRKGPLLKVANDANARLKAGDDAGTRAGIEALRKALPSATATAGDATDNMSLSAGSLEFSYPGVAPLKPSGSDPLLTLVQRGPSRPPRGTGPGGGQPSLPEVMRTARFNNAARELRELEPNNRQLSYVAPPGWVPSGTDVEAMEFALGTARGRATGRPNSDPPPSAPEPAPPLARSTQTPARPAAQAAPTGPVLPPPTATSADIAAFRARIGVPDTRTAGVARTNVPGLETKMFEGGSKKVREEGKLAPMSDTPIESPNSNELFRNHAEQDLANQFIAEVEKAGIQAESINGRELLMRIQNENGICTVCRQGLRNDKAPGVLRQLSLRYPGLRIHVVVDNPGPKTVGPLEFVIIGGRYAE